MINEVIKFIENLFSIYFVLLLVICGVIIAFVYPMLAKKTSFPIEYKIGKYVGYIYIIGGVGTYLLLKLFNL